jgi:cobalt/nickel transport system ATP-binding protein
VADRAIVLGEDHAVAAAGPVKEILAEHDLLMRVNLIHEHLHAHGGVLHSHAHHHADDEHSHDH